LVVDSLLSKPLACTPPTPKHQKKKEEIEKDEEEKKTMIGNLAIVLARGGQLYDKIILAFIL